MVLIICIEIISYKRGEDCSHIVALIFNVVGAMNNGRTASASNPCQMEPRFSISFPLFFQRLYLPLCITSCFQNLLFNFVTNINSFVT